MYRSSTLTAVPVGVDTVTRPEVVASAIVVESTDEVFDVTVAMVWCSTTRLLALTASKFAPLIVSALPMLAITGEKLEIDGAPVTA